MCAVDHLKIEVVLNVKDHVEQVVSCISAQRRISRLRATMIKLKSIQVAKYIS